MPKDRRIEDALRYVIEGTVSETGTEFFRALVRNVCTALGTHAAWVTEFLPSEGKLRAYAMWLDGSYVDHYEYEVHGTPCQRVIDNNQLVHIPDRVIELFPLDPDLPQQNAVSYLGAPILDTDGRPIGHLGVLDNKPMTKDPEVVALFEVFAARAAGEMRRIRVEEEVRSREEQLSLLLDNTLDAILVLDPERRIVRLNTAVESLLSCTAEDVLGESIEEFLVPDSAEKVKTLLAEIEKLPAGKQQLWVPQNFAIRRWDHSVFPAEITLSRFTSRKGTFYTLILRNADQRLDAARQIELLTREANYLREMAREATGHGDLLGRSNCMQAVFDAIRQVAPASTTVLVCGETGTGKELVARSIHKASPRAAKPLVLVNCAAIPASLIESEFFGHEKGAFTGAVERRMGRFQQADGGTLFLDEVGELPLELQAKLLRVLQEGEIQPIGGSRTVIVDVRIVAATNRDLQKMVSSGTFREDLYFRLNVFPIAIPPLRDRGRDVEHLASVFINRFARQMGKQVDPLDDRQRKLLREYKWPGNVRELQNVIERAVILTAGRRLALEQAMCGVAAPTTPPEEDGRDAPGRILNARELEDLERRNLLRALEACDWTVSGQAGAARLLGIPPTTLSSRMKALGISRPRS